MEINVESKNWFIRLASHLRTVTGACVLVASACAQTPPAVQEPGSSYDIPILNAYFADDVLFCDAGAACFSSGVTGWICGALTGIFKPGSAQYPTGIPNGTNVVAVGSSLVTGSIVQTTGYTLSANTTYALTVTLGARADAAFTGYKVSLMAGNVVIASDGSAQPAPGTFVKELITVNTGDSPPQLGLPLQIRISSLGSGQVNINGVSLVAIVR